jgi:hypothetical protein
VWYHQVRVACGAVVSFDEAVAGDAATDPVELSRLAFQPRTWFDGAPVKSALARNLSTPPAVLASLAADRQMLFDRLVVFSQPSCPSEVLVEVFKDRRSSMSERHAVVAHPVFPFDALVQAARIPQLASSVGCHPRSPDVLAVLSKSRPCLTHVEDLDVRARWRKDPADLPRLAASEVVADRLAAVSSPDVTSSLLEVAASVSDNVEVAKLVAGHPLTPPSVLRLLARRSWSVPLAAVALSHPSVARTSWAWVPLDRFVYRPSSVGLPRLSPVTAQVAVGLAPGWSGTLSALVSLARETAVHPS